MPQLTSLPMKAIVYRTYGSPDVLQLEETAVPTPTDDHVLIRVHAAGVNPYDWRVMRGSPSFMRLGLGLRRPKEIRLGIDVAGVVETVGRSVTRFKAGDAVFGACRGAFAEYACASEAAIVAKPANVTFEQAGAVAIAGYTALQALRNRGGVASGAHVLINGASGGVGTFAVQIAKSFGAHVTGVSSARNGDLIRSLGADRVIDYAQEDFTRGSERYDLVLDCHATHPVRACARMLTPRGRYIIVGAPGQGLFGPLRPILRAMVLAPLLRRKLTTVVAKPNSEDLARLAELMKAGTLTPVVDRRFRLQEVREAISYVEQGHARGKVVITVA